MNDVDALNAYQDATRMYREEEDEEARAYEEEMYHMMLIDKQRELELLQQLNGWDA